MKISKEDYDKIVQTINDSLDDSEWKEIEINFATFDVIVEVITTCGYHYEVACEYMGQIYEVPKLDYCLHEVIKCEIWDKDGSVQYNSDALLKRLKKDIV